MVDMAYQHGDFQEMEMMAVLRGPGEGDAVTLSRRTGKTAAPASRISGKCGI